MNKKSLLFTLFLGSVTTISFVISSDNPQPKKSWWQFWKSPAQTSSVSAPLESPKITPRFSFTNWLSTPVSKLFSHTELMKSDLSRDWTVAKTKYGPSHPRAQVGSALALIGGMTYYNWHNWRTIQRLKAAEQKEAEARQQYWQAQEQKRATKQQ